MVRVSRESGGEDALTMVAADLRRASRPAGTLRDERRTTLQSMNMLRSKSLTRALGKKGSEFHGRSGGIDATS